MLDYERSRRPDADPDAIHYIMSEAAEYDLRVAVYALRAAATLHQSAPAEASVDITPPETASILYVVAEFLNGIVNEVQLRVPPAAGHA